MNISNQAANPAAEPEKGPRARTRRLMIETAVRMMQAGIVPSVAEVAEEAEVSRATAYRYFPSQAALVGTVVDRALGPILDWRCEASDPVERVRDLFASSWPRMDEFEATFRAALKLALDQREPSQAGQPDDETRFRRGHRVALLRDALSPLAGALPEAEFDRLAKALSLVFGVEAFVVLKDIWGCDADETARIVAWTAEALLRAATAGDIKAAESTDLA
ncbi:TetR family transcriptional regulator [Nitratireductor alexandrii]|uniref:TetR family transcriptional regulator n=1 Tax=Nitratireductor alexandrii TaxID=2448161 RepID=UPI000FD90A1B|nr:TetR family transcriptional regulator [Nitratireductor alexandrii]